jgi:predicted NBD/HSP70 family sugar kinase
MSADFRKHGTKSEHVNILRMIDRHGQITRKKLVELTGFSQAKISTMISELTRKGLVSAADARESSGGRRANLLQLSGRQGHLVGVELGGHEIKVTLTDFSGKVLTRDKMPTPLDVTDPRKAADVLIEFMARLVRGSPSTEGRLKGIGIALSGVVNQDNKTCAYFRNQKSWEGFPLMRVVEEAFSVPCVMDDSSRMMAVAEEKYGSCQGMSDFVVMNLGVGVGAGIFVNGSLFRSAHGFGGEVGHMVIKENGPRCVCGNYGCLESFVAGYAIERQLQEALKDNVYTDLMNQPGAGAKTVIQYAQSGDKLAYSIIIEAAKHLGVGIANIVNIFSPEAIILAGGVSMAGELLLRPLEQGVRASALGSRRNTRIMLSSLDEYSGSLGVARYWLTEQLSRQDAYEILMR